MRHERTTCGELGRIIRPVVSAAQSWTRWILLAAVVALALPFPAMAQTSAREAGSISALIPVDNVLRQKKLLEATKDMKLLWGDTVKTERGGRVRVRLNDGSILNVGSQSSLTIETHDTQAQRTQLQLAYGRMRASVVRITQPDGAFQVRTTAAVAGVVGTDEFLEASIVHTTVIALGGGLVTVGSPNPNYATFGSILSPGEAITLIADQRPGEKRLATDEELGSAFAETGSDEVVQLEPRATFPGQTMQARIVGKNLVSASAVSFARAGISISMSGPPTATVIPVSITVAQDVPLGTYPFTVQQPDGPKVGVLIVTTEENSKRVGGGGGGEMKPPAAQNITAIRGAKFKLDASTTQTPAGTSIVAFLWRIAETRFSSNLAEFTINTSFLKPGDYVIQLVVINDRGQVATQVYNLTVDPGIQPTEIIRELASGYESLQPNQFLKYFDQENFRNYAGFAATIEDSFRNQLETIRVFQRPVNCSISEEQDQATCQADFELQFTKKDQPTEPLDANGDPFQTGVVPPSNATQGKRILTGSESSTIRFERGDKGWKIVDYNSKVSCFGGPAINAVNVGTCAFSLPPGIAVSAPPFTLSQFTNPNAPLTLLANSSVVIGITAATSGTSFNTPVTITFGPLPAGVTISPSTANVLPGSTQPFIFTFVPASNNFANFGVANVTVTGTAAGVPVQTSTILLNLGTAGSLPFALFSSPSASNVTLSGTSVINSNFRVFVSSQQTFNQPINISVSTPPPGITISPNTSVFTPGLSGSNVLFSFTVDPAVVQPGSYPILISGVSSGVSATTTWTLNVLGAFSLSVTPNNTQSTPMVLLPDGTTQNLITVTATSINNFSGSVTVTLNIPSQFLSGGWAQVTSGNIKTISVPAGGSANAVFIVVGNVGAPNTTIQQAFIFASSPTGSAINSLFLPFMTIAPAGFSLSPSSRSTTVIIGGTSNSTSTLVQPLGAFGASVDLTVVSTSVPAGITVTPATQTIAAGSSASFTITAATPAVSGNYAITVNATSPGQTAQTFTINVRALGTLTISVTQSPGGGPLGTFSTPLVLAPGAANALTFNVSVGSSNGFSGSARVRIASFLPSGVTAVFTSTGSSTGTIIVPVSGTATDTLTLTNSTAAPTSVIQITVLADDPFNNLTNTNPSAAIFVTTGAITLNVLTVSGGVPGTLSTPLVLNPGASLTFNVSVGTVNGFLGSAQVQAFGMPSGVTAVFTSTGSSFANLPAPGSDTLTLTASQAAPPLPVTQISVLARSLPSLTSSATSSIFISSASTFVLGCAPFGGTAQPCNQTNYVALNINQPGGTSSIVLQVDSFGGYSGTVNVVPRNLPAGMTMSPNPATLTPGVPVTVTFSAVTPAVAGSFTVILDGSDTVFPTLTSSTNVDGQMNGSIKVVVTPATSSSAPLIVAPGAAQTFTVDISGQNGFSGSTQVDFSPLSSPTGVTFATAGTQTVAVPSTGSVTLSFTVTAAASAPASSVQTINFDAVFNVSNPFTYFVQNESLVQTFYNVGPVGVGSYLMSITPASGVTNPIPLDPNGTTIVPISVTIVPQSGFLGAVNITLSALPSGVTVTPATAQVVITSSSPGTATFNFSATTAQGLTPITVNFNAAASVTTPGGVFPVNNSASSFLLVNPPPFSLTLSAGTSAAPISLEQGIPPGQIFQVSVTGAGTATITFSNVPAGVNISPPTANIAAGSSATFTVDAAASAALGNYIISVVGTSAGQLTALNLFVNVVVPTNGFFLASSPPTSAAAPVILQPDHSLVTFLDINVLAKGTFTGVVNLAVSGVPTGVTATLTPSVANFSISSVQVAQLQFQTTTGIAPFSPAIVTVTGTAGTLTASTPVFVALQIVSAIQAGGTQTTRAPEILQVLPPGGSAGSHMVLTLQGSNLNSITQVMTSSTKISAQLEPGGSDSMRRLDIFARLDAAEGAYTLMLVSPNGIVPVGIKIEARTAEENPNGPAADARIANRGTRGENRQATSDLRSLKARGIGGQPEDASQAIITRVEPAILKPGDVVEGKLIGENLSGVTGVRAVGQGIGIEMLEATDSEIRVRFTVALNTTAGSRMLTLLPGRRTASALLEVQTGRVVAASAQAASASSANTSAATQTGSKLTMDTGVSAAADRTVTASSAAAAPDLAVRSSDFSMSPAMPRPGDDVTFRVLLTNRGTQDAQDVEVEFTLGGANVRVRDHFNVAAGGSQSFQVQWQASGTGRFAPRVVIDPDRRVSLVSRANTTAAMPAFELFSAASAGGRAPVAMKERGQLTLSASGCQGFRFSAGTEQACNGGADMEVRVAPQGGALRIEADGVRNLGAMPFDSASASQVSRGATSTADTLLPGNVYLVETRSGAVLVRVMDIRGMSAVRRAAPAAMNRPGLGDVGSAQGAAPQNNVTVFLEWRLLSQ